VNALSTSIKSFIINLFIVIFVFTAALCKAEAADAPSYEPPKWKGNIAVGGNYQTGNTDRFSAALGADAERRSEKERYNLKLLLNYSEEDSTTSSESYYGAGQYDYFFTKKVYGYIGIELLKDKFQDLTLRTVLGPGAGYQIWDEDTRSLKVEGGISYFFNNYDEAEDDDFISGRLSGTLMYKLLTSLTFTDQLIIYPSFENFGEFQLRNDAALSTDLASGWALKLINILEYDSDPPPDIEETDWNWLLSLQYSF